MKPTPIRLLLIVPCLMLLLQCSQQESKPDTGATIAGTILRLDPRLDALVPQDARLEKLADGFAWVEGPVWDRRGGYLLFSDIPNNVIHKWREGEGISVFLQPSGYSGEAPFTGREPGSNGLVFDAEGRLVLCEHGDRRISRLEADGSKTTLVDNYQGQRLNSPNDAVFHSSGALYFTDPPFGLPKTFNDPGKELDFQGVYRLAPDGTLTLLTSEIGAPNGIGFSPDERTLYVTDVSAASPGWLAFDVLDDGTIANGRVFADARPFIGQWPGAPDGLAIDSAGNLFGSGPGGIYIFAPDGSHLGAIVTTVATANCAWGDDGSVLYITADTAIYRIRLTTRGVGF